MPRNLFPHLQVWRICGSGSTYYLVGDTELAPDSDEDDCDDDDADEDDGDDSDDGDDGDECDCIFSGTPNSTLKFQAGDILGIFQPRDRRSRVGVYYDTSGGPTNYYIRTDDDNQTIFTMTDNAVRMADHLPLVTVKIGKFVHMQASIDWVISWAGADLERRVVCI